eukprot:CAMPEP_0174701140 /NCGR_PEP_ID=MMETSP1094-20130205/5874_1 /TAXON_ID=156173 /ORGANISM="Chrysochromulina brevifilum, Strain UTEX LB 985" /LENGTH=59 /DNA_ID=CAMNT_0015898741 /DNA_START=266 /DNA_END=445 /DNA_ORIENTATION=+
MSPPRWLLLLCNLPGITPVELDELLEPPARCPRRAEGTLLGASDSWQPPVSREEELDLP